MGKTKQIAIGAVLAGAAGYVAGILTAPKSGKDTRTDLKNKAVETKAQAEKQLKQLQIELGSVLDQAKLQAETIKGKAKEDIDMAMDKTRIVKEKASELLDAIQNGHADDKDLRKAIDEANQTIAHLRTYLKKQ